MADRAITLADEPALREGTSRLNGGFSEHCAANLILYRKVHHYCLRDGDLPFITGVTYDGQRHAMPLFALTADNLDQALSGLAPGECLYPVSEELAAERAGATLNADDSDYVFETASLATLAGSERKLRRLQARKFAACQPLVEPLGDANVADALAVLDGWVADVNQPWGDTDASACREAIEHRAALGLFGIVVRSGPDTSDPAVAMLLAAELPENAASVLFAKALRSAPGAFPFMISAFAAQVQARFQWLNFEQDLGRPGFRQAKRSYAPQRLLHKYRLFRSGP